MNPPSIDNSQSLQGVNHQQNQVYFWKRRAASWLCFERGVLTEAGRFWYNSRVLSRESVACVRESIAEDTKKGKNGSDKDQGGAAH